METPNSVFNTNLFDLSPKTFLTWVRTIIANRLASSAEEWTDIFQKENSGTCNNQFMILDVNKINLEKKELDDKALMIIQQLPKYTETHDVTNYLKNGYWPSYNVPFSEYIFNISGYPKIIEQYNYADKIDYKKCARAKIFERDQGGIKSNEDFKKILMYNDYQNDEFSKNDSSLAIAARNNLLIGDRSSCFGANDAKFISVKELLEKKNKIHIIAGPTYDQQPIFSWKNTTCDVGSEESYFHEGIIETWNFSWMEYDIQLFNRNNDEVKDDDDDDDDNVALIVICCVIGVLLVTAIIFFVIRKRNSSNNNIEEISHGDDKENRLMES